MGVQLRGRKRDLNAKRRKKTRLERTPIDRGTPEAMLKRLELVNGGDPVLAENPLGILLANDIIKEPQHRAGHIFATHRYVLFGKPFARLVSLEGIRGHDTREDDLTALWERYRAAVKALKDAGRLAHDETWNITVEQRLPGWFRRAHIRKGDERRIGELKTGLDALVYSFGCA